MAKSLCIWRKNDAVHRQLLGPGSRIGNAAKELDLLTRNYGCVGADCDYAAALGNSDRLIGGGLIRRCLDRVSLNFLHNFKRVRGRYQGE